MPNLGFLGSPHTSAQKWSINPTGLYPWLWIVWGGGRCHGTPMWPQLFAPTYWHLWKSMCSHSLFTTAKRIKKVEAKYLGEMPMRVPRCRLSGKIWAKPEPPPCRRVVWKTSRVSLGIVYCLKNEEACLPLRLFHVLQQKIETWNAFNCSSCSCWKWGDDIITWGISKRMCNKDAMVEM